MLAEMLRSRVFLLLHTPVRERSTAMSMSVCLCVFVYLPASVAPELHVQSAPKLLNFLWLGRHVVAL